MKILVLGDVMGFSGREVIKKYLPKIPHSLNIPKLTPVFLTKTIFKKGYNCMSSKLLFNIILDTKIFIV